MPSDRIKRGQKRKAPANDDNQHSYDYADLAQGGTVELISTTVRPGQRAEHHREVLLSGYVDPQQPPSLSSFESGAFLQSDFLNVDYFSGVHEAFVESLAEEQESEGQKKEKKRRYVAADEPLLEWIPLAQEYLEEMLRWEGRGHREDVESCDLCHDTKGQYRCKECAVTLMLCQACCVSLHKHAPLHRVEVWTGSFFQRVELKLLGLRVQLGHTQGKECHRREKGNINFVVVDVNGIHNVNVDFCSCTNMFNAGNHRQQLLRYGWFPSTHSQPQTAFSFRVLETYHMLTLQGKMTMYDFYGTLEKLTDNTGLSKLQDRYQAFTRVIREFRFLKNLKRRRRAHDVRGVTGTKEGELALPCPACPRPSVNLPNDWKNIDKEKSYLYNQYLGMDACFRLKRRMISSASKDPGLSCGLSYFVEDKAYKEYLLTVTDQDEMSTCTGLAALDYANTKFSKGYEATGCGLILCARHEFIQANGVGDLQKGERYANMDYIAASILKHHDKEQHTIISYDIACQWSKNFLVRLEALPEQIRPSFRKWFLEFVVPKLHIRGHTLDCQGEFSLNYLVGSGMTDGEGVERPWANLGGIASSTREMGPGARHETLDDHFSFWNWQKLIGCGKLTKKRLSNAIKEAARHREAFEVFSDHQKENIREWTNMVKAYESDKSKPNPYKGLQADGSITDIRLAMAAEELELEKQGRPKLNDISGSAFVHMGLEIEEQQRRIKLEVQLKRSLTGSQQIDLGERRAKLSRRLAGFRTLQATYTPAALPAVSTYLARHSEPLSIENTPIYLPSSMTNAEREGGCAHGISDFELRFRDSQCQTALNSLRNQLSIKSRLFIYKGRDIRHQAGNTRMRALLQQNEAKINMYAEKYRAAWLARRRLGAGDRPEWKELNAGDIVRQEGEGDDSLDGKGSVIRRKEGIRTTSWIWMGAGHSNATVLANVRAEWCKARARAMRWREEVALLEEEKRRILVSMVYESTRWLEASKGRSGTSEELKEGLTAYALQQADMYSKLGLSFAEVWTNHASQMDIEETDEREKVAREEPITDVTAAEAEDHYHIDDI